MSLNDRQRIFCENIIQGMSQTEAYIKAGYSERGARKCASRLSQDVDICRHLSKLRSIAEDKAIMTAKQRKVELSNIAKSKEEHTNDRIRSIAELNKMDGAYEAEKVDIKVDGLTSLLSNIRGKRDL